MEPYYPKNKRIKTSNLQQHEQPSHFHISNTIILNKINDIDAKINSIGSSIIILCSKFDNKMNLYENEIIKLTYNLNNLNILNNTIHKNFINLDKKIDLINQNIKILNEKNNITIVEESEIPQEMLNAYG